MKRIDTINARENMFGIGKSGFHDNADLPGQDATYVSPEWFNVVQEELCNLLELRGIVLDPASKRQLYDLLTTQADLEALADETETNFIRKNQIVDNLITNDASKPVSAKQAKVLQDNKLDKTENAASATKLATASGGAPSYAARAWVNFNGTGTVAINASSNVSSITDVTTGCYEVNFITAMPTANYCVNGFAGRSSVGVILTADEGMASRNTTLKCGIQTRLLGGTVNTVDADYVHISIIC
jgi:hypothetical protein